MLRDHKGPEFGVNLEGRIRSVVGLPLQWEEFVTFVRREALFILLIK